MQLLCSKGSNPLQIIGFNIFSFFDCRNPILGMLLVAALHFVQTLDYIVISEFERTLELYGWYCAMFVQLSAILNQHSKLSFLYNRCSKKDLFTEGVGLNCLLEVFSKSLEHYS